MSDDFKQATGYTKGELSFALSWGVAALQYEDFIDMQYEDTKDPGSPGEDADKALAILQDAMKRLDQPQPQDAEKAWTFFGHWDGELVIDHAVVGEHDDVYPDQGEYEEGVWAASASGATIEEAEANARAEYEDELPDCGEDFMAGTICSLPEGHEGPHAPICRRCGVDWYLNDGCKCPPSTDD